MTERAAFGMIGLGVMGRNLALNVEEHGFSVAVWNLEASWTEKFLTSNPGKSLQGTTTLEEFVAALERPRRIFLMITAGAPVDATIQRLKPLLEPGDIVMDGGNSWFTDTQRREKELRSVGFEYVGCGVSGGEEGARRGPAMMPGCTPEAWERVKPVLEAIAARTDTGPCVARVGSDGAGHFVKMVHNGIEYADMQLLAEAYDLLSRGTGMDAGRLADLFAEWNRGPLASFLVELTAKVFRVQDTETKRPLVDLVQDRAGQKGTGKWTVQAALDLVVPTPSISAAVDARVLSSLKDERVRASGLMRGAPPSAAIETPGFVDAVRDALHASRICCYAQGMALIAAGSAAHGWGTQMREIARIWRGGCILRSRLLDVLMRVYDRDPKLPNILVDEEIAGTMSEAHSGWRRSVAAATQAGLPVPVMAASLAYYDSYRTARLPQNLTQAQRDAFGSHTYERVDKPGGGFIHTDWLA
ncbi:MAG: NADP-dependent phosphogluconate dehydrogenase [Candidatus Wallbacteria bacterium]|nr:NADP-dependent phosphogluconate dehydrogenase [Candidatus Wallbacteria bacterium]